MRTISFISANYVGRTLKYNGDENWGTHDQATAKAMNPETFRMIARDIADGGFNHIDLWTAHCNWQTHGLDLLGHIKSICQQFRLTITSYAGGLTLSSSTRQEVEKPFRFMKQLGAPIFAGGMWGADAAQMAPIINDICQELGVKYAFENHPEKTPEEILKKIGDGKYANVGVALDTGWCGTNGMDAVEAAKKLRNKLFIVHLKDVKAVGKHDTCTLGDGIVPVEKVARYLVDSDWQGTIGIEHEPYDRDPMPEVKKSLQRVREWLE
ncbi:MAG: sugar phosphate isomerase/epimerase family protein [Bacillota bacterium]